MACNKKHELFKQVSSDYSGIHFNNNIPENDSLNVLNNQYIYNGGGVGIGDFNNDGLPDIYFTGNVVSNKLYLNKGKLKFEDVTKEANVTGEGKWCSGVAVVDINNDGWLDIYVCVTNMHNASDRKHLLYINQGADKNGVPVFKEMAAAYGLADTGYTTNAAFFDYDNDGDLDLYLINNKPGQFYQNTFSHHIINDSANNPNTDVLYENVGTDSLGHPFYKNVSAKAGIHETGYGLGLNICDINNDGWKDIYVSNDFISSNVLYINNHDKTFTDKAAAYIKHTSFAAMGNSVSDINNDALPDIVELDMNPEDNYRKKMMLGANNYLTYQNFEEYKYLYQYTRNTLQINQGPRVNANDSIGDPIFSEAALYAGIAATDWSWTPLVVDFDYDGFKDIIITNGFPKDLTDHDFIAFRNNAAGLMDKKKMLDQIPQIKLRNYAYKNNGDVTFSNVTDAWGIHEPSFSNGAVYADLDNDGDLDYVVNNINDEAFVFENELLNDTANTPKYIRVKCKGDSSNINAIGATLQLYYDHSKTQLYENSPYKGYLSTVENIATFGLPNSSVVDSLVVSLNGRKKVIIRPEENQTLVVDLTNNTDGIRCTNSLHDMINLFTDVTARYGVNYVNEDYDFIDFNQQKLLPHKLSEYGPALAVGDINGDKLDDIVIGGSYRHNEAVLLQQKDGKFIQRDLLPSVKAANKMQEDMGILLFDADNDGDEDIYITSGSEELPLSLNTYVDRLYINDGKGNFSLDTAALPFLNASKSCVKACDYNHDGRMDLFVGERVKPGEYPKPVSGHILKNVSADGHVKFVDVTSAVAPGLMQLGLFCDALWTDIDNDGWQDLIIAGEYMPLTVFKNNKGSFTNISAATGVQQISGCWNSIVAGDFNNDGLTDYVVGNMGDNTLYKASNEYPVSVYAKDFNNDGIYDVIPSLYLYPNAAHSGNDKKYEYPAHTRDDILKQLNSFRKRYPGYAGYATATMEDLLPDSMRANMLTLKANCTKTCLFINKGNGKFDCKPLPMQAQLSGIYGMVADDFNNDGNVDVLLNGNDYGAEVYSGRCDALNGLLLLGDGNSNFTAQSILQSGIFIPGNGKALAKLRSANGEYLVAASQHNGPLKIFSLKNKLAAVNCNKDDAFITKTFVNGKTQREEMYNGSSFLSQSALFTLYNKNIQQLTITSISGNKRTIQLNKTN
jgi:hypothetical protein